MITQSSTGRSWPPVRTVLSSSTTFLDSSSATSPKMVCLPCNQVVGAVVMKNCEPLVPRPLRVPAFAMASMYGALKFSSGWISSSKL